MALHWAGCRRKCFTAFQASRARIAMVIGDMPSLLSDCALGLLGPRGAVLHAVEYVE